MRHRVKTSRGRRVAEGGGVVFNGPAALPVSSLIMREGGLGNVDEVEVETAPGCIVIGPVNNTTPPTIDRRRVDHERIQAVVIEVCRKMGMLGRENMDFAELCVTCGFELGRS